MRGVIKLLILSLVFILYFCYGRAITYYCIPLIVIIITGLILYLIWNNFLKQRKSNFELFLTFSSIVIAILLFILPNLQLVNDTNETLISINKYNCNVSKELEKNLSDSIKSGNALFDSRSRYITEAYKNDMAYLLQKLADRTAPDAFEVIKDMERSNRKLDMIQSTGSEYIYGIASLGEKEDDVFKRLRNTYVSFSLLEEKEVLDLTSETFSKLGKIDKVLSVKVSDECKE